MVVCVRECISFSSVRFFFLFCHQTQGKTERGKERGEENAHTPCPFFLLHFYMKERRRGKNMIDSLALVLARARLFSPSRNGTEMTTNKTCVCTHPCAQASNR